MEVLFLWQKYQYDVKMTCGGCSSAVTRALTKILPGQSARLLFSALMR